MYKCPECRRLFEEPNYMEVCWESEYGVASMFQDMHYGVVAECPYCGTPISEYDLYYEEEEDDDFEE